MSNYLCCTSVDVKRLWCRRGLYLELIVNSLISYCNSTKDFMVPSLWGQVSPGQVRIPNKQPSSIALIHLASMKRLKNVTTLTHHSKLTAAVPSCKPGRSRFPNLNHQRGVLWTHTRFRLTRSVLNRTTGSINLAK